MDSVDHGFDQILTEVKLEVALYHLVQAVLSFGH